MALEFLKCFNTTWTQTAHQWKRKDIFSAQEKIWKSHQKWTWEYKENLCFSVGIVICEFMGSPVSEIDSIYFYLYFNFADKEIGDKQQA